MSRIAGLELRARHVVEGYLAGIHRSPFHGRSVEFAEHRPYAPGQELRHVDWRLWARTDRFYVKLYEQETNVRAHFLVDGSASMSYGSGPLNKYDYGCTLAASLAYLLLAQRDAVGLAVFDDAVRTEMPASSSSARLREFCTALESAAPAQRTDLGGLLHSLAARLPARGLVVLVSDLLAPVEDVVSALHRFSFDGHSTIVIHVIDPDERDFPFDGRLRFEGLETGDIVRTDARRIRAAYAHAFHSAQAAVETACRERRIDYVLAVTDGPVDVVLARFLSSQAGGY